MDRFYCRYNDRCPIYNKLSSDEQNCCDNEFYQCPIWQKYHDEDLRAWTWWQIEL